MRRCYGLHWTLHHCPLSQALLLWCHNVMAVIVPWNVRGPERETYQHPGNANSRRSWAVNRAIIFWISMQFVAYFCWITPYTCTVFNPECVFCVIHALKITMTPKTEIRGSKMTPCHFCGNLKFSVPTSKTMIFLMILIIKSCKNLWYRPNKDPFIAFYFDCIYSVRWSAQHYKQSHILIFPLHHCIAWLKATM